MNTDNAPLPRRRPSIIAHRGASAYAPENTMAAFQKAIEIGADYFELDVQLTLDGTLAVFHDRDISRFAIKHVPVVEMRMSDMRRLDIGSWFASEFADQRVISLEQALELAQGKIGVYVELKSAVDETPRIPDMLEVIADVDVLSSRDWQYLYEAAYRISADSVVMARRAIDVIRSYSDRCRIVAQAFSPIIAAIFLREAPDIRFEFLGMDLSEPPNIWRDFIHFGEKTGVAGFNVNKESLDETRFRRFRNGGYSCAIWVVDEPEDILHLAAMGVDALISNKPDVCLATLI
jgi:glycerophosphoryl diester phosphodiesterase